MNCREKRKGNPELTSKKKKQKKPQHRKMNITNQTKIKKKWMNASSCEVYTIPVSHRIPVVFFIINSG